MTDVFNKEKRSWIMSRVTGKNTKPEISVRKILHGMGFRYRLHVRNLPGNPDIVLPRHKKVIFVHGCFWHGHENCKRSKRPTTNEQFWNEKINHNIERDLKVISDLNSMGWEVLTVWECETKDPELLKVRLIKFLTDNMRAKE